MNAVEIEQAISELALQPIDAAEFAFDFLAAFGNKDTTLKRLRTGNNNTSDVPGGVLLRNNIHMAVCEIGNVGETLKSLRASPATTKAKAKFILATDGQTLKAEELIGGETINCVYAEFPDHFGFFLPLAGISTIKEIKDNPIDVRATGRLNKLYLELLNENPDWAKEERRADMNHFMARLVFCFFAEDTDIFNGEGLFTKTVEKMSDRDGSNTEEVLEAIFRAMNIKVADRPNAQPRLPNWANGFPYVNGGLFSGSTEVPHFTRMARTYLLHAGSLKWREINPDIFGSMIQAVADDEERGSLGMHYTSVPNILKVLNPLFLDDLRVQLDAAGDNKAKLLNLRKRMARIRVFDPACGSGNFLVIAYKQMREIEAEINIRRGEEHLGSEIPLTNFRGIELRNFPAEIARLALIIAEFQCDVLYRGQKDALAEFLPLDAQNWIVCHNALQLDWLSVCPPTGIGVKLAADDLFSTPLNQSEIDFENEGGETYVCGNPPYRGSQDQTEEQKNDLRIAFSNTYLNAGSADYILGWFVKGKQYIGATNASMAFVTTNSVHQGRLVGRFWPYLLEGDFDITFAEPSFLWSNLAVGKAAVTVSIIGLGQSNSRPKKIFDKGVVTTTNFIGPYLVPGHGEIVYERRTPISAIEPMVFGSMPNDGGHLILESEDAVCMNDANGIAPDYVRPFVGTSELTSGQWRKCLWFPDDQLQIDDLPKSIEDRFKAVRALRAASSRLTTRKLCEVPHRFGEVRQVDGLQTIVVGGVSTESRKYLPAALVEGKVVVSNLAFAIFDSPLWAFSILTSSLHRTWIATVCGKMRIHYRYSNTLGWNTFPIPLLTEQNKVDLNTCAENILLAKEAHFPANITDLYNPETMPENLRHAHERNDEVLERIYIGRRFKNDTERLEKLFELYTKMTATATKAKPAAKATRGKKTS